MSYARRHTTRRRKRGGIEVGKNAKNDPVLAMASSDASRILLGAAKKPVGQRLKFIRAQMRYYGPGASVSFEKKRQDLLSRGWEPNQATYDAMRLVASNAYAREAIQAVRTAMAIDVSGEYAAGLGGISKKGRKIGCGVVGGVGVVGGLVASIYGGKGGGTAVGTGTSLIGGTLDCNKEQREAAEAFAEEQAAAAQKAADTALATAQLEAEATKKAAEEKTKQVKTMAIAGGAVVGLLAVGYAIVAI